MADTLALTLKASLQWVRTEALDLSSVIDSATLSHEKALTDGTSASQSDLIWHDTMASIAVNGSTDLDLTALTQTVFGSTVTIAFAKIKGIIIINTLTTAGDELIIGGGSNPFLKPWNDVVNSREFIGPGGIWVASNPIDGWAVTNSSNDNLRVANPSGNSGAATPQIVIWGTSV